MEYDGYERHIFEDPRFPIISHIDQVNGGEAIPNWHQSLEFLYFLEGCGRVMIDTEVLDAAPGDLVAIPANALHVVRCAPGTAVRYFCLIVDWSFCLNAGIGVEEIWFRKRIRDPETGALLEKLMGEVQERPDFYKPQVLSYVLAFLVRLARNHQGPPPARLSAEQSQRLEGVKRAILYMEKNYAQPISVDMLASRAGFSKYYFCHSFKALTGMTTIDFLNFTRCRRARELLEGRRMEVGEAAAACGFANLSYFSRTYRRYMGELPSQTRRMHG